MIKFKTINGKHIVTFSGNDYVFDTLRDAWKFIFRMRGKQYGEN